MDSRNKNNIICVHERNHVHELLKKLKQFACAGLVTDLTLLSGGERFHMHHIVFSCFSNYFEYLAKEENIKYIVHTNQSKHVLEALIDYIYEGITCIPQLYKNELIMAATTLHIRNFTSANISDSCGCDCSNEKTTIGFPHHKLEMSRKIGDACRDPSYSDVIFIVSNKHKVFAHACILSACSPFLLHLFTQHGVDKKKPYVVALHNVKKADLELVLEFCYKGKICVPIQDIQLVYNVADLLGVDSLCKLLQPVNLPLKVPTQEKRKCTRNVIQTSIKPTALADLLKYERLVDVFICTKQKMFKAHSVVLCMYSVFFKELATFLDYNVKDIIILIKDLNSKDIEAFLDYMYIGEVQYEGSVQEFCEIVSEWLDLSILPITSQQVPQATTWNWSSRQKCESKMNPAVSDETVSERERRKCKETEKGSKEERKEVSERAKFVGNVKEKDIFAKENKKESNYEMSKDIQVFEEKKIEFLFSQENAKDCEEYKAECECLGMRENCGILCVGTGLNTSICKINTGSIVLEEFKEGIIKNEMSEVRSVNGGSVNKCIRKKEKNENLARETSGSGCTSLKKKKPGNSVHYQCSASQELEKEDCEINEHRAKSDKACQIKKISSCEEQNLSIMNDKPKKRVFECQTCNEKFYIRWEFKLHLTEHPEGNVQQCKLCQKKFHRPSELQIHLRSHSGVRPLQCEVCGMSFTGKNTLRKHEHIHLKSKSNEFQCEICKKSFSRKQYLHEHERTHTGSKPYECEVCHKSFVGKTGLNHHKKTHKKANEKKSVVCEICGKSFTRHALWTHMKHHNKEYKCEFCSKCFATAAALKTHVAGAHLGHCWHHCSVCGKGFVRKGHLSRHVKTHEQNKNAILACSQCPSKFKDESTLRTHTKRKHSEPSNKPLTCSICSKPFSTQSALSYHQRLHFHERPHRCNICNKTFAMPYQLRDHIRLHHSDEKLFPCSVCSKKCATQALLNRHLLTHRPTFTPKIKPPGSFTCMFCDKTFPSKLALSNHSRSHSFSRPYHCNVCKKAFRYQDSLLKHLRLHPNNPAPEETDAKELPCIYTIQVRRSSFAPAPSGIIENNDYTDICHSDVLSNNAITEPVSGMCDVSNETTGSKTFLQLKAVDETYLSQSVLQSNKIEYMNVQPIKENCLRNEPKEQLLVEATHNRRPFSITIDGNLCCDSTLPADGHVTHSIQTFEVEIPDEDESVPSHVLIPSDQSSSLTEHLHMQASHPAVQSTHQFDGPLVEEFSI